jgi:hypothetical protein
VEVVAANAAVGADEIVLKVAKTLQSSFSRQTTGEPRKWRDVPADERKMWVRLARTAQRILLEADSATAP